MALREITKSEANDTPSDLIQRETLEKITYKVTEDVKLNAIIGDARYGLIDVTLNLRIKAEDRKYKIEDLPLGQASVLLQKDERLMDW